MSFLSRIFTSMFASAGNSNAEFWPQTPSININNFDYGDDGSSIINDELVMINPATGLQMNDGAAGLDIMGNPYGVDFNHHDDFTCGNDSSMFSHDCGSSFDPCTSSFDSGSMFDNSFPSIDTGSMFD
jgi:hypothetical protein